MDNYDLFVKKNIELYGEEVIRYRREFHKNPEIGFEEYKTSEMIVNYLNDIGLKAIRRVAKTGVVVDINPHIDFYCVAIRVDIDALPITEETGMDYQSLNVGKMHACGHDGHISIGLGIARILNEIKDSLQARVRIIFQPAEEGLGGAKQMILDGVLDNPKPDLILGLHIWPSLESGKIGIKEGPIMAAGDKFTLRLIGVEGHGSSPHLAIDPTIMAAEIIQGFQNIVGRKIDSLKPAVISVGTITSGKSFNTIPYDVLMTGTTRYIDENLQGELKKNMEMLIENITKLNGGSYEFNYEPTFNVTNSDRRLVELCIKAMDEKRLSNNLVYLQNPSMASEDFSEYEKYVPGLYFFIGNKNEEKGCTFPLHSSKFKIDEDILLKAVEILCYLIKYYVDNKEVEIDRRV